MSETLKLFSLCNRPTLPVSRNPQLVYFLTELLPGPRLADVRMPLNLVLALDRSAGMAGERLRQLKEAVNWLLEQLQAEDVISIVVFGRKARTVIAAQEVGSGRQLLDWASGVRGVGKQCISAGLAEALKQAGRYHSSERISRIVLVVGGRADDAPQAAMKVADQAGAQGIPIACVGLGLDAARPWDEELLIELSDRSMRAPPGSRAGSVSWIAANLPGDVQEPRRFFDGLYRSMQICARDSRMSVRPARGVHIRQIWQTRPALRDLAKSLPAANLPESRDGIHAGGKHPGGMFADEQISVHLGELGVDGVNLLFEALLEPRPAGAVRIAQNEVAFHVPGAGAAYMPEEIEKDEVVVEFSQNLAVTSRLEGYVMDIVQKAQSLKLQTQALQDAEAGDVSAAAAKLRQVVPILMSQGEVLLADRMRKEVDHVEKFGRMSGEGRKLIRLAYRANR